MAKEATSHEPDGFDLLWKNDPEMKRLILAFEEATLAGVSARDRRIRSLFLKARNARVILIDTVADANLLFRGIGDTQVNRDELERLKKEGQRRLKANEGRLRNLIRPITEAAYRLTH